MNKVDVQQGLLPAILSGRADAMLGGFLNVEGVDLKLRGKDPTVIPVDRLGIPTYNELVLVANSDRLDDSARASWSSSSPRLSAGTKAAVADPAAATKAILDAGQGLDPKMTAAEVRKTLPLLLPTADKHPYGYMDPGAVEPLRPLLRRPRRDQGPARRPDDVLTNDYLPGAIP